MNHKEQLTLPLKSFLDFTFYNGLFHSINFPLEIVDCIISADPEHKVCYPEFTQEHGIVVWYPIQAWYEECKRRKEINDIDIPYRHKMQKIKQLSHLNQLLIESVIDGNLKEIERITKEIEMESK
jgi:hypothetical protein